MKTPAYLALMSIALLFDGRAATLTFDFKDSKGVNNVVFELDAPLESIKATAKGISGSVTVDPTNLTDAKGRIVVATNSLVVPNPLMRAHLLSKDWLSAKSNPEISFEIKRSDFGIRPGEFLDKVSNEIDLSLSIAGAAAKGR
jgi:polyisoprenoid-binding protein YceI